MRRAPLLLLAAPLAALAGCSHKNRTANGTTDAGVPIVAPGEPAKLLASIDPSRDLRGCSASDQGPLIDFGDPFVFHGETIQREGEVWARVEQREIDVTFFVPKADTEAPLSHVALRVHLTSAKSVEAFVNGRHVGRVTQKTGDLFSVPVSGAELRLRPGANRLQLRFTGAPKVHDKDLAEIAWVHLGFGPNEANFRAPTRSYLLGERTVRGTARRSVQIRPGAIVRCTGFAPPNALVRVEAAASGGDAELIVRVLDDRKGAREFPPIPVRQEADAPRDLPLGNESVEAITVEFQARSGSGARVAMIEPRVAIAPPAERAPPERADSAVLVVLGFVDPHALRPFGGSIEMPRLESLARDATIFDEHYATSAFANGSLASVLTGMTAGELKMRDGSSRLPKSAFTLARATGTAGFLTGFFTANPTTFASFGFGDGWTERVELPLAEPGLAIFDRAATFVRSAKGKRFFAVVHARGAHPPWDLTATELKNLAPPDYAGAIDPRHAGDTFARARHVPPLLRLSEADHVRTNALIAHALTQHDRALGTLLDAIRETDPRTLVIVTGDVGPNASLVAPFGEGEHLNDGARKVPLLIRWPGRAGGREPVASMDFDIGGTLLEALGMARPPSFSAANLAAPGGLRASRPIVATSRERSLTQVGAFVLERRKGGFRVCDLRIDPDCLTDLSASHPITLQALMLGEPNRSGQNDSPRESASIGAKEALDLLAWGHEDL